MRYFFFIEKKLTEMYITLIKKKCRQKYTVNAPAGKLADSAALTPEYGHFTDPKKDPEPSDNNKRTLS